MPVSTHSGVTEGAAGGGDGQGYNSRGAWTSGQDYAAYDIVTDGGQTFECYLGISNSTTAPDSDTTHFRLWAAKGANGADGSDGADGANGTNGTNGTNGSNGADGNTILNGTSDPTSEGVDGDFFLNTDTNVLFGPKASGSWPATGVKLFPAFNAWPIGSYLLPDHVNGMDSNTLPTSDRLIFIPFVVPKRRQVTNIAIRLVTAQASAAAHVGIYSDTVDGLPGSLISNDLTLDLSTGGGAKKESLSVTASGGGNLYLEAGKRYWAAFGSKGVATNATVTRISDASGKHIMGDFSNVGYPAHWRAYQGSTYTYGALPGTAPSVTAIAESDIPVIGLKAA